MDRQEIKRLCELIVLTADSIKDLAEVETPENIIAKTFELSDYRNSIINECIQEGE